MHAFTVHEYRNSRSSPNTALDKGCQLLDSLARPKTQWVYVRGEQRSYSQSSNSYMFNVQPHVPVRGAEYSLKEWNAACTEDEVYSIDSLEEFSGTDLRYLLVGKIAEPSPPQDADSLDNDSLYGAVSQSQPIEVVNDGNKTYPEEQHASNLYLEPQAHKESVLPFNSQVIPGFDLDVPLKAPLAEHVGDLSNIELTALKKRRPSQELPVIDNPKKRKIAIGSLYRVVPQPHMHPSPFVASPPCPSGTMYTRPPLWTKLPSPSDDARVAWLIPVRGALPWEGSTPAVLDEAAVSFDASARISWTLDALLQFWDFVLDLRRSATFGSVGVALHPAATANVRALPPACPSSPGPALQDPRTALPAVDFIKIYHDAYQRLYIRAALDEWAFRTDGEPREARPLSGARLVLVDEISQAILIV